jgi:hypothetical protein
MLYTYILHLLATCHITCASSPSLSILQIVFPHSEVTISEYLDVVASAPLTIFTVSNLDDTRIVYLNASSVFIAIFI